MSWTRADIRSEVRSLTGRKNTSNPSDNDLNDRINRFIKFKLIQYAKFLSREEFYQFNTVAGTSVIPMPDDTFQFIEARGFIDDDDLCVYRDPEAFWNKWQVNTTQDQAKPRDVLLWAGNITLRAIPDDIYTVRLIGFKKESELTDDSSTLSKEGWGEVVAYGTSVDLLNSDGNFERAQIVERRFKRVLNAAMDDTNSQLSDQRAMPKW